MRVVYEHAHFLPSMSSVGPKSQELRLLHVHTMVHTYRHDVNVKLLWTYADLLENHECSKQKIIALLHMCSSIRAIHEGLPQEGLL